MFRKRNRSFRIRSWCQVSANSDRFFGATLHARLRAFLHGYVPMHLQAGQAQPAARKAANVAAQNARNVTPALAAWEFPLRPNICQFSARPFKQQNRKPSPRALSLFVDGVAKVIACNRIDHGGHQLTRLRRSTALRFTYIVFGLLLQFKQARVIGNGCFQLKPGDRSSRFVS
jgi:hypothetical protein